MATVHCAALLAIILVLQSHSATANSSLSPLFGDNPCKPNVCGKGNCVVSNNTNFGFECQCEKGWKQARSEHDDSLKFLPCVIPNCTLNLACSKAPAPVADHHKKSNSIFDPCFWTDCGGGSCNKTSLFTHNCECEEGYYNLFNSSVFPCYKECAIGGDCAHLGLNILNSSSSSPRSSPSVVNDSSSGAATLIPKVEFGWMITMVTTLALAVYS